jgi:hypothetical protein
MIYKIIVRIVADNKKLLIRLNLSPDICSRDKESKIPAYKP